MPYCNACGTEVPEAARFCQNCGTTLTPTAAPVGASESAGIPTSGSIAPLALPPYAAPPTYAQTGLAPPPSAMLPGQPYVPARNGKAIAGMWLGIASIIPGAILTWVGILIGITGIIFSLLALSDIRSFARRGDALAVFPGKTEAIAGIICGIVGIACSVALLVYVLMHYDLSAFTTPRP